MEQEFRIRSYSKLELAILYNPSMSIPSALRTLSRWISVNHRLCEELAMLNYNPRNRIFTPRQVQAIVTYLGEP